MSLSDRRWWRQIRGGYWVHRSHSGWAKVTRKTWKIYRNNPLTQPRVVCEDHSHNDGLIVLVAATATFLAVYAFWLASIEPGGGV